MEGVGGEVGAEGEEVVELGMHFGGVVVCWLCFWVGGLQGGYADAVGLYTLADCFQCWYCLFKPICWDTCDAGVGTREVATREDQV